MPNGTHYRPVGKRDGTIGVAVRATPRIGRRVTAEFRGEWINGEICALFNLVFEYSARGFREFVSRPLLVLALFGIYLSYFAMVEDLMVRYRLTNRQLFLVAFLYGLFPTAFLTGNLFNTEIYGGFLLAGVNLGTVIVIGVLAWGVIQGVVTLYLANRLAPRDWDHPRMGWAG